MVLGIHWVDPYCMTRLTGQMPPHRNNNLRSTNNNDGIFYSQRPEYIQHVIIDVYLFLFVIVPSAFTKEHHVGFCLHFVVQPVISIEIFIPNILNELRRLTSPHDHLGQFTMDVGYFSATATLQQIIYVRSDDRYAIFAVLLLPVCDRFVSNVRMNGTQLDAALVIKLVN